MIRVSERKTTGSGRSPLPISTTTTSPPPPNPSSSSRPPRVLLLITIAFGCAFSAYHLLFAAVSRGSYHELAAEIDPVVEMRSQEKSRKEEERAPFHVAMTANDSPYSQWQSRIMYYWYKRIKSMPGGSSDMGGFTRILHSGVPDGLVNEIPTFVVNPLPPGKDMGYIVLNRPWAFVQWLRKAPIKEDYILMAEPDHIFVKPLPNLARGMNPAAFPFFYIIPGEHEKIIRKFYPENRGPVANIDPIGNSPTIIHKSQLEEIAPTWMNISMKMKADNETDKTFGWVLEMYGYAIASALHNVQHILRKDFMIQPPFDTNLGNAFIIHYTYGCDYNLKGELTYGKRGEWRFDKRSHLSSPPPRNISMPPPGVPESVVALVEKVNEATANIPNWDKGR